ncbi:hypothetical protein F4824DRAFT_271003 [Ustulina deusta]|nr:hypothetical protein F4824DRAFT_271003 [Ustulina deusta]
MSSMFYSWKLEILAIIISALSLVALVILLLAYDGEPIFLWHGVTLNAIVSILTTTSKASFLLAAEELISQWKWILFTGQLRPLIDFERIDSASRGPLGSLLVMLRCKHTSYLYIGTLTVLLSLAIEPLAQQIVQRKQSHSLVDDATSTVARAIRYSKGVEIRMEAVLFDPTIPGNSTLVDVDADLSMQSAVLYGLDRPLEDVNLQAPFKCPSVECEWPMYESLAVCAQCRDVTNSLERLKSRGALYASLTRGNLAVSIGSDGGTAFRLPNGLVIDNSNGWQYNHGFNFSQDVGGIFGAVLMSTFGTGNASETVAMQDLDTLIWSMSMIRVTADPNNSSAAWPALPISATECALMYCVNSYKDMVINGSFLQTASPVSNAHRVPKSCQPYKEGWEGDLDPHIFSSIEFSPYYSEIFRSDLSLLSGITGCAYNISQAAVDSISSFIRNTLSTRLYKFDDEVISGRLNGFYIDVGGFQYAPSVLQQFQSSNDLNSTFTTLAASMSNAMRSTADESVNGISRDLQGQKSVTIVIYSIQWPWIALHVLLVAVTPIFLVVTLGSKSSPERHAQAWKSSSLAVMTRGPAVLDILEGAQTVNEMKQRAKNTRVTLLAKIQAGVEGIEQLELDPLQHDHNTLGWKHGLSSSEVTEINPSKEAPSSQVASTSYEHIRPLNTPIDEPQTYTLNQAGAADIFVPSY